MPRMFLLAQLQTGEANWWWSTLTSGRAMWLLGFALLCVVILLWLGLRLRAVSQEVRKLPVKQRLSDDSGVAMVEFVLVTPILLTVTLLLIQTMLVFTGLFYVQYAAFAAARSAIVVIRADMEDFPNELSPSGEKASYIVGSAMIALTPVCGRESSSDDTIIAIGPQMENAFSEMYRNLGEPEPAWVNSLIAQRLNYAINRTEVAVGKVIPGNEETMRIEPMTETTVFSPKEAIVVQVRHEFALSIPLASRVFSAVGDSGTYTPAGRDGDSPGPPGQWTAIQSIAILTNEGIDRRLPEAPEVPRR
ncbi:MAG: TadE/TadG family type IV pilus assembly protein [Phycisphaeraceae bacterium]